MLDSVVCKIERSKVYFSASKCVIYIDKFERRLNYMHCVLYQILSVYILNYVLRSHYLIFQRATALCGFSADTLNAKYCSFIL